MPVAVIMPRCVLAFGISAFCSGPVSVHDLRCHEHAAVGMVFYISSGVLPLPAKLVAVSNPIVPMTDLFERVRCGAVETNVACMCVVTVTVCIRRRGCKTDYGETGNQGAEECFHGCVPSTK